MEFTSDAQALGEILDQQQVQAAALSPSSRGESMKSEDTKLYKYTNTNLKMRRASDNSQQKEEMKINHVERAMTAVDRE